jgi:hypothetical protein
MKLTKQQLTQLIKEELSDYVSFGHTTVDPGAAGTSILEWDPDDPEANCPPSGIGGNCLPLFTDDSILAMFYEPGRHSKRNPAPRRHPSGRPVVYNPAKVWSPHLDPTPYTADFPRGGPQPSWEMALSQDRHHPRHRQGGAFAGLEENMVPGSLESDGAVEWDAARANPGVTVQPGGDPWPGYEAQMADLGTRIDTLGDIYDTFPILDWGRPYGNPPPSPSWEEAIERARGQTDLQRREREYRENPPPWLHTATSSDKRALWDAWSGDQLIPRLRSAGSTGWGPGSLEESIKEKLKSALLELKNENN